MSTSNKEIANYLISKDYLLTALEFFTELSEDGVHMLELKEYFANHRNFEHITRYYGHQQQLSSISAEQQQQQQLQQHTHQRQISQVSANDVDTLSDAQSRLSASERIDVIRERDEYIAVLEYECRQAKDAVEKMKAKLASVIKEAPHQHAQVQAANQSSIVASQPSAQDNRVLNFIVYQYLLQAGYKMSSLTFADENEDVDLDDWNDVSSATASLPPPQLAQLLQHYYGYNKADLMDLKKLAVQQQMTEMFSDSNTTTRGIQQAVSMTSLNSITPETVRKNSVAVTANDEKSVLTPSISTIDFLSESPQKSTIPVEVPNVAMSDQTEAIESKTAEANTPKSANKIKLSQPIVQTILQQYCQQHKKPMVSRLVLEHIQQPIDALSSQIQRVIPSVVINKREELLQILVSGIRFHQDDTQRAALIQQMFSLIKKPDARQVDLIATACNQLVTEVPSLRQVLVSICLSQLANTKFIERKILATEICGVLVQTYNSQVIEFLCDCAQDANSQLRYHACRNLAMVVNKDLNDDNQLIRNIMCSLVNDASQEVQELAMEVLSMVYLDAMRQTGRLQGFIQFLFDKVGIQHLVQESSMDARNLLDIGEQYAYARYFRLLEYVLPHLLIQATEPDEVIVIDSQYELLPELRKLTERFGKLDQNQSVYHWVVNDLLDLIFHSFLQFDPINAVVSFQQSQLLRAFCTLFGSQTADKVVRPRFGGLLTQEGQMNIRLVPVLICGYIPSFQFSIDILERISLELHVIISLEQHGFAVNDLKVLRQAYSQLCLINKKYFDPLLQTCVKLTQHQDPKCRITVAQTLCCLIPHCSLATATKRLIPAMIQLSNDSDRQVRLFSLNAYCALLEVGGKNQEILEKLEIQLAAFMSDPLPQMQIDILKLYPAVLLYLDESFRENFILPAMARWCQSEMKCKKPSSKEEREVRIKQCLSGLQVYQSFSGLLHNDTVISQYVLPSLALIKRELPHLVEDVASEASEFSKNLDNILVWVHRLIAEFAHMPLEPINVPTHSVLLQSQVSDNKVAPKPLKATQSMLATMLNLDSSGEYSANRGVLSMLTSKKLSTPSIISTPPIAVHDSLGGKKGGSFFTSKLFSKFQSAIAEIAPDPQRSKSPDPKGDESRPQSSNTASPAIVLQDDNAGETRTSQRVEQAAQNELVAQESQSSSSLADSTKAMKSLDSLHIVSNQSTIQRNEDTSNNLLAMIQEDVQLTNQKPPTSRPSIVKKNFFDEDQSNEFIGSITSPLTAVVRELSREQSNKDFVIDTVYQPVRANSTPAE